MDTYKSTIDKNAAQEAWKQKTGEAPDTLQDEIAAIEDYLVQNAQDLYCNERKDADGSSKIYLKADFAIPIIDWKEDGTAVMRAVYLRHRGQRNTSKNERLILTIVDGVKIESEGIAHVIACGLDTLENRKAAVDPETGYGLTSINPADKIPQPRTSGGKTAKLQQALAEKDRMLQEMRAKLEKFERMMEASNSSDSDS